MVPESDVVRLTVDGSAVRDFTADAGTMTEEDIEEYIRRAESAEDASKKVLFGGLKQRIGATMLAGAFKRRNQSQSPGKS